MNSLYIESLIETIGQRIHDLRESKNLSQKEVIEKCGLHKGSYSKIESGSRCPSLRTLLKIAIALEVPPSSFFDDERFHMLLKEHKKD